ncbi:LytR/AlgR family response regulator transcription factor [Anditalea andensis]|uniref:LytTR family transcriptional regulator n=1 Tax=Anditalea andensis TaxID=1048983 RepID=A0A074KWC5_9BACT|nr:LytTR family DNA-binding domain-containing protein [Anditalea andensis]KEO71913.1 hypothetical protein EL17_20570 [Anditalea andensis]
MKCIVIDDERIARQGLIEFIKEFDYLEIVGDYANAKLALANTQMESIDLIFLDIQMPSLNGLDFAKLISDHQIMIIFTTAFPEYALEGYQFNAVGYLLKPIFFDSFSQAVQKAKKLWDLSNPQEISSNHFFIRENGQMISIDMENLTYISGLQNYIELNMATGIRHLVHQTLKSIIEELPKNVFVQIHKSYIVNIRHISKIDGALLFIGNKSLPVSRDRRKNLLNLLQQM